MRPLPTHPTHNTPRRLAVAAARWLGLAAVACAGLASLVGSGGGGGGGETPAPALTVISTSPTNGATGVAVASTVSASFSENLAATPTLTVTGGGGAVAGAVSRTGATATFTPAAPLAFSTTYTASVSGGSGAAGGTQSGATTWTFTTVPDPNSPPALTLSSVTLTFNATFGGANPTAQTVSISNGGGGTLSGLTASVVSYGGGPTGWIQSATLNSTTAPATLTIQPAVASLAAGNYTALVQVAAGAGATGSPQQIQVNFNVAAPNAVTISGTVDFQSVPNDTATNNGRLLYGSITNKPIRGATVQVLTAAAAPGVPAFTLLASGTTSSTGTYSLGITAVQPVIVRVRAEMLRQNTVSGGNWNFTVRDNTQVDAQGNPIVYALDSPTFTPVAGANTQNLRALSGQVGTSSTYTGARSAGPFAILDVVYDAKEKILAAAPGTAFPALQLMWSVNNQPASGNLAAGFIGTSFYQFSGGAHKIYILGFADVDTDEYDRPVVAHEFGHYVQSAFSRDDSIGGSHSGGQRLDMRVAFSEGWGNAWSGMALASQYYTDSTGNGQQSGFRIDLAASPATNRGWFNEASVQYLMYQWHANGAIGFTPIWNVLSGFAINLPADGALSGIHYFAHKLKQAVPAQAAAIDALLSGQSITVADALGTTESNSGSIGISLPVYKQHTAALNVAQQYCVTDAAGTAGDERNKLGARVFIRVPLAAAASRTISVASVSAGSDPDLTTIQPNGVEGVLQGSGTTETLFFNGVIAGTYLIVLHDYTLTDGPSADGTTGQRCFNVTVQ